MSRCMVMVCAWLMSMVAMTAQVAMAESAAHAAPDYLIEFPRDEGSHPGFRTEWWYVTGWVRTAAGDPLGFQLTFFRVRTGLDEDNPSSFALRQLMFAHAALSDPRRGRLLQHEKSARAGFGLAQAAEGALDVSLDDWFIRGGEGQYQAFAAGDDLQLDLQLQTTQSPVLQGRNGFSQKGPDAGVASHYYSLPQLTVSGAVVIDGQREAVQGHAWFDHEWSGELLDSQAQGWDWVGLNLHDGGALMIFQMRDARARKHWANARWRDAQGHEHGYAPEDIIWTMRREWRSPRTGVRYPVAWQVQLGERVLTLEPLMDDQEHDTRRSTGILYWEGAVRVFEADREIGEGYLEMTGYGGRIRL